MLSQLVLARVFIKIALGNVSLEVDSVLAGDVELVVQDLHSLEEPVPVEEADDVDSENDKPRSEFCPLPKIRS